MQNEIANASVITIGDELMIGQVTDTNSAWIAQELNKVGIWVRRRVAVGDDRHEILRALDEEASSSQIVLITGGLGPTADDITKPLLCEYFNMKLVTDENVLQHVQHLFPNVFKRPFTDINRKQAEVPDGCIVIHNARGTAPGMWFEKNNVIFVSMPGVPYEMKGMMTDLLLPMITSRVTTGHILHRTLLTAGLGESALAELIKDWEASLPQYLKLAYLPNYGMVRLRITGISKDKELLEDEMESYFVQLQKEVQQWLVTSEDINLVQVVSRILKEQKKKLVTAESCTGGYISHLLTSEPGSSEIFNGSVVAYANNVKEHFLHVNNETLIQHGAVSEQTVIEMVKGTLKTLGADYCLATSGIMGPGGGTPEKPVGTVWVAAGNNSEVMTQRFHFRFDRSRNIEVAAVQALNLLRKFLLKHQ